MIRPLVAASAFLLLLASCAPSVSSSNYAEQISENHYRYISTLGIKEPKRNVVPVRAGTTLLFEDAFAIRGIILAKAPVRNKRSDTLIHNTTNEYEQKRTKAPRGWGAQLKDSRTVVDFNSTVKAPSGWLEGPYEVYMGGGSKIEKNGTIIYSHIIEVSVPKEAQPGRYPVEVRYRGKGNREDRSTNFIVEVL